MTVEKSSTIASVTTEDFRHMSTTSKEKVIPKSQSTSTTQSSFDHLEGEENKEEAEFVVAETKPKYSQMDSGIDAISSSFISLISTLILGYFYQNL